MGKKGSLHRCHDKIKVSGTRRILMVPKCGQTRAVPVKTVAGGTRCRLSTAGDGLDRAVPVLVQIFSPFCRGETRGASGNFVARGSQRFLPRRDVGKTERSPSKGRGIFATATRGRD